jgi:cell division protein FtsQ
MARKPSPTKSADKKLESAQNRRKPKSVAREALSSRLANGLKSVGATGSFQRFASVVFRLGVFCAVLAVMYVVWQLAERHVRTSASFAIKHIDVTGNEQLTTPAVLAAAGLAIGQNVFAVGPEEARQALAQHPWIESVSVRRRLPGRFTIELRERHAVATMMSGRLYLVSDDGLAFKPLEPGDPYDLPVISGLPPLDISPASAGQTPDDRNSATALMSAVALLHDYRDAGLARREPISEIHVEEDSGLSLYVGADATYVRLGKPPFRQKLDRFRDVMNHLAKQKTRAAYVYLDNQRRTDRVTARLR